MSPAPQDPRRPFERDAFFDDSAISGARWWNRSFDAEIEATRRQSLKFTLTVGGIIGGATILGVGGVALAIANDPDKRLKKAVDVQRALGWSAGAFDKSPTWPAQIALDRDALDRLALTLKPRRYAPFFVGTQLEALDAQPSVRLEGTYVVKDLKTEMRSVRTEALETDKRAGEHLAKCFAGKELGAVVIVDCPGARSAAFAAGASSVFEPVLVLDNWPHPVGVVPAHRTLSALATFEADLASGAAARGAAPPPLFVLERERTAPLTDAEQFFDNRYFATLPAAEVVKSWGFSRALLIVDRPSSLPEAGDLSVLLGAWAAAGIDVRVIGLDLFAWDGTYAAGQVSLFHDVPWATPPQGPWQLRPAPYAYASWKPGASREPSPRTVASDFGQVFVYEKDGKLVGIDAFGPPQSSGGTRDRASGGWGG